MQTHQIRLLSKPDNKRSLSKQHVLEMLSEDFQVGSCMAAFPVVLNPSCFQLKKKNIL